MNNILIVDDHRGIRVLLRSLLEEKGYTVEVCSNGREAVQQVTLRPPELILMDIRMPGMGGISALQEISYLYPEIPIIMMSAYSESDEVKEARVKGKFTYYVEKPFDLKKVVKLIEDILNKGSDL